MKLSRILTLFALLLLVYSCQKELQEAPQESETHQDHNHEADLRQVTLEDWEPMACADISIFIEDCAQGWTDGVNAAMDAYNALDAAIIMSPASSAATADIVITCVDIWTGNISGLVGLGEWPVDDFTVGGQIYLNTDYDDCNDPCFFQGFAMHELGHNLGLAHDHEDGINLATGTWDYDPITGLFTHSGGTTAFGEHIPGTPTSDPNSIFLSFLPACGTGTVCTFSAGDELAFEILYPEVNCDGGGGGDGCEAECPTVEVSKQETSPGRCQWRVFMTNDSDCEFYFDITNPPPYNSSTGNVIPANNTYGFHTGNFGCNDGPVIIEVYGIDENGERFECERIELRCCDEEVCPCPSVDLTKIDAGDGCSHWRVGINNDTACRYYFDITNPPPFNSSTGNLIPQGGSINFQTATICCKDGPIIINIYTIDEDGNKQYCEPIVLSSCDKECEGMEDCMEVGFRENFECQLRAYFNECSSFTNGNSSFTWNTPSGPITGGIFVNATVDGVYCLTVTFKNGCVLTDCIIVEGCKDKTKL